MNYEIFISSKVLNNQEATISLALLERGIPDEVPPLRAIEYWAEGICRQLNCTAKIYPSSDVITFYPVPR